MLLWAGRIVRNVPLGPQDRVQRKVGNVKNGEHDGVTSNQWRGTNSRGSGGRLNPLALQHWAKGGREGRTLGFQCDGGVGSVELETKLRARHHGAGRDHDERKVGGLGGALEAIPKAGGRAAEFAFGDVAKVEDDETEIGVAGKEIGGGESRCGRTADPHEMGE